MSNNIQFNLPDFANYQKEFFNRKERFQYILAAPQVGKTVAMLSWITLQALQSTTQGRQFAWVSPYGKQARDCYQRLKLSLQSSPLVRGEHYDLSEQRMEVEFFGKGMILFVSSDNYASLFGKTIFGAVIDEAGLAKEEAYNTVITRLSKTNGPLVCISNLQGNNWFYQLFLKAEMGHIPNSITQRITIDDAIEEGVINQQNIDEIKTTMSNARFRELYYLEIRDDSSIVFSPSQIASSVIPNEDITDRNVVCYGIDLAKSSDWTVITGVNSCCQVVESKRFQKDWVLTKQDILNTCGKVISVLIDSTSMGDVILEDLEQAGMNVEGYTFTNPSKVKLIQNLIVMMQKKEVTICEDFDYYFDELSNFEMMKTKTLKITYAAGSGHDDAVCALALACYQYKNRQVATMLPFVAGQNIQTLEDLETNSLMSDFNWIKM